MDATARKKKSSTKQYLLLAVVVAVIVALLANDRQLSKPLVMALSIVAGVTGLLGFAFAVAWRVHKRREAERFAEFDDLRR